MWYSGKSVLAEWRAMQKSQKFLRYGLKKEGSLGSGTKGEQEEMRSEE